MPLRHVVILKSLNTKINPSLAARTHAGVRIDTMVSVGLGNADTA